MDTVNLRRILAFFFKIKEAKIKKFDKKSQNLQKAARWRYYSGVTLEYEPWEGPYVAVRGTRKVDAVDISAVRLVACV